MYTVIGLIIMMIPVFIAGFCLPTAIEKQRERDEELHRQAIGLKKMLDEKKQEKKTATVTLSPADQRIVSCCEDVRKHKAVENVQPVVHTQYQPDRTNCPNCGAPLNEYGKCEYCTTMVVHRKPDPVKVDKIYCENEREYHVMKLYADNKCVKTIRVPVNELR